MAAPKLRTPTDATISAPVSAIQIAADAFVERCRARHVAFLAEEAERKAIQAARGPSPAFAVFKAALDENAARWVQARRDALAGSDLTPVRDRSPGFKESAPMGRRFIHV